MIAEGRDRWFQEVILPGGQHFVFDCGTGENLRWVAMRSRLRGLSDAERMLFCKKPRQLYK